MEVVVMKRNEKQQKHIDMQDKPLFTGDYLRDSSVTEVEKIVEVSKAICRAIEKKIKK